MASRTVCKGEGAEGIILYHRSDDSITGGSTPFL